MTYSCVKDFQDLSDRIVQENWDDAVKVYAFTQYMADNYAYDTYQVEKLDNIFRGVKAKDPDNPKYWLYKSHVGMCQDFTNAMVIMCRHHGIPCTSISGDKHVMPLIYMNNEWVGIDATGLVEECTQKDMNPALWEEKEFNTRQWSDRTYGYITGMNEIGNDIREKPAE